MRCLLGPKKLALASRIVGETAIKGMVRGGNLDGGEHFAIIVGESGRSYTVYWTSRKKELIGWSQSNDPREPVNLVGGGTFVSPGGRILAGVLAHAEKYPEQE